MHSYIGYFETMNPKNDVETPADKHPTPPTHPIDEPPPERAAPKEKEPII